MFKNHIVITLRRLSRKKGYAILNVVGLALGLAVFGILMLFIRYETSYERFHENVDRIHMLLSVQDNREGIRTAGVIHSPVDGPTILETVPEVEQVVRVQGTGFSSADVDGETVTLSDIRTDFVDASIFDVFTYPLITGDPATALINPGTAVIDRKAAIQLFGTEDPAEVVGRSFEFAGIVFEVTGLMESVPPTTRWRPNILLSLATMGTVESGWEEDSGSMSLWTFLLYRSVHPSRDLPAERQSGSFHSQPISQIHLHGYDFPLSSSLSTGQGAGQLGGSSEEARLTRLRIFALVAALILLLGTINYVNLATAYGMQRAREVGVRKTLGASRSQIVTQSLSESVLLTIAGGLLALLLINLGVPYFNSLIEVEIPFDWLSPSGFGFMGMALFVGLIAGLYPALVLSRSRPTAAFRGGSDNPLGGKRLRQVLVTFQFTIGISLAIISLVMVRQIGFMQNASLGMDPEHAIEFYVFGVPHQHLTDRLLQEPSIHEVAWAQGTPTGGSRTTFNYTRPNDPDSTNVPLLTFGMDEKTPQVLGMDLIVGSWGGPRQLLINETAARERGWTPEEALGQTFPYEGFHRTGTVAGVVRDFHYAALHEPIESVQMRIMDESDTPSVFVVRFAEGEDQAAMDAIRMVWDEVVQDQTILARFLADHYSGFYGAERRLAGLFWAFGIIAVIIACLGLFGLAAFTAERRVKEVGIRKVLGADTSSIVKLLSKDFAKLVVIAFVIAAPIAWWAMNRWLDDFAYHITLGPGIFLLAGLGALVVALATVSYHAIRAANADPVRSLRSE